VLRTTTGSTGARVAASAQHTRAPIVWQRCRKDAIPERVAHVSGPTAGKMHRLLVRRAESGREAWHAS